MAGRSFTVRFLIPHSLSLLFPEDCKKDQTQLPLEPRLEEEVVEKWRDDET
jgi:hypothetical protein